VIRFTSSGSAPSAEIGALRLPNKISPEFFRNRLADIEALPQLSLLAVLAGLITGCVILLFRAAVELILGGWLLPEGSESFEALSVLERLALPIAGAGLIGLALNRFSAAERRVGVVHVMERLSRHQGYLPWRNAAVQFFGGIAALASGQSGGREGPAIHLGAASSSLIGQIFRLPNNSLRTLVACGSAAAIASSFNTPIAGVIFAMEVVMMEYTIGSFIPVIIAAVTSTLLTHYFIGDAPAFTVAPLQMQSLSEVPFVVLAGIVIGCTAAGFTALVQLFARLSRWPFWSRALLAGSLTGLAATMVPAVMGIGYDTVNAAMLGQLSLTALLLVALFKSISSAAAVGLGLPVGLIGPTLVIGAALGGSIGMIGNLLEPAEAISEGFYVMLGMAAMMAAVLQAPLAALMAVMELTLNPNLILPAMLMIVVATLVSSVAFKQRSVFISTLKTLGLEYPPSPVTAHMQRAGVAAIMCEEVAVLPRDCSLDAARMALEQRPLWIAIASEDGETRWVLKSSDLAAHLESEQIDTADVDLLNIPGMRRDATSVDVRCTVDEAQMALQGSPAEALCVRRLGVTATGSLLGIVTQEDIDTYRG
jgi:CIC family chloride channel protein